MKKDFLLDAIGEIDDELLLDAELPLPQVQERPAPRRGRYWGGLAAALAVCIGLWAAASAGVLPGFQAGSGSSNAPLTPGLTGGQGMQSNGAAGAESPSESEPYLTAGSAMPSDKQPSADTADPGLTGDGAAEWEVPTSPAGPPEEADNRAGAQIFIAGRQYVPGVSANQPPLRGTALGELTCPVWGFGVTNDGTDGAGGADTALLTNVPEYDGLTVWEADGRYFLELPDGSFLALDPWEE